MSHKAFEKTLALCAPALIVLLVFTAGCNGKSTTTEVQPGTDQAAVGPAEVIGCEDGRGDFLPGRIEHEGNYQR